MENTDTISLPWLWRPVKRRMLPGCDLFLEGDTTLHAARKFLPLEPDDDDCDENSGKESVRCCVIGCQQSFTSLLNYENHYSSVHRHWCVACRRSFPSSHLLDIHLQENHDPLFAILAARQNMYQCLVVNCDNKFWTPVERRQHLIHTHNYPHNFRFHRLHVKKSKQRSSKEPDSGTDSMDIDKPQPTSDSSSRKDPAKVVSSSSSASSLSSNSASCASETVVLCAGSSSDKENAAATGTGQEAAGKRDESASGMEVSEGGAACGPRRIFVHRVPKNFSFGQGVSRGFQRPPGGKRGKKRGGHWHQRDRTGETTTTNNIENVDMGDMAEALKGAQ